MFNSEMMESCDLQKHTLTQPFIVKDICQMLRNSFLRHFLSQGPESHYSKACVQLWVVTGSAAVCSCCSQSSHAADDSPR